MKKGLRNNDLWKQTKTKMKNTLLKLTEETENMNSHIPIKEIEFVIKNSSIKKIPETSDIHHW